MVAAFTHVIDHHAVGADQAVYQRLNGHSSQTDLGVGDHHTSLDDITLADFHLQTVVDHLKVQTVLRHLTGHDLVLVVTCKQRQDSCSNLHVVDTAVAFRQQCTGYLSGTIIHRADHVRAGLVRKPAVHILGQKFRLLRLHEIIVFSRDTQCRCHLTMEQGGRTKHLLLAGRKMVDFKSLSIFPEAHSLRRTDEILLYLILTVQLNQDFLQISSCFHSVFPFISAAHIYTPVYASVSFRQKRRIFITTSAYNSRLIICWIIRTAPCIRRRFSRVSCRSVSSASTSSRMLQRTDR